MTIDKVTLLTIEKWLKSGNIGEVENRMYVITSSDHCRAIENIKKSGYVPMSFRQNCENICNAIFSFDLTKDSIKDALYDEEFQDSHVNRNQNGLSIASYISLYFQECYPEERENFTQDILF